MAGAALKIICPNKVPPRGYRFKYLVNGQERWSGTENNSLMAAYNEAVEFYHNNNLGDPPTLRQIEQDICEILGPEWCMAYTPQDPIFYPPPSLNASVVVQGLSTILHHVGRQIAKGTRALVPEDEVKRRAAICCSPEGGHPRCRFNYHRDEIGGCATCSKKALDAVLSGASKILTGCPPTPHDAELGACSICGCPLRSKICVEKSIILENMPKTQQDKLPKWCWLKS